MGLLHSLDIIKDEGIKTFSYVLSEKIKYKTPDSLRYKEYIKNVEPKLAKRWSDVELADKEALLKEYICVVGQEVVLADEGIHIIEAFIQQCAKRGDLVDLVYGDHDYLIDGKRSNPSFKPDFSPDTLKSFNYIGDFWIVKKSLLRSFDLDYKDTISELAIATWDDTRMGISQYEALKGIVFSDDFRRLNIKHINYILCHCKQEAKGVCTQGEVAGTSEASKISESSKISEASKISESNKISEASKINEALSVADSNIGNEEVRPLSQEDLVSIIIPSKDNPKLLEKCVTSIERFTKDIRYELVVVDNGSQEKNKQAYETFVKERAERAYEAKYIYEPMEFNFSHMCNLGAKEAKGNILLFLNDDIEVIEQEQGVSWLYKLASKAKDYYTGAVGAKLLYPDRENVQHIGVVNLEGAGLVHLYGRHKDDESISTLRNVVSYNYLAVTGACICVMADKFRNAGGFDEKLTVTKNDVDLCIGLFKLGYYNVCMNEVVLIHHESFSRGLEEPDEEKKRRIEQETEYLFNKHPEYEYYDPFVSPHLSQKEMECEVNPEVITTIYRKPLKLKKEAFDRILENSIISERKNTEARMTCCEFREDLQLRGFCYDESGAISPEIILFSDKAQYAFNPVALCNRIFHYRKGLEKHNNFAAFIGCIDTSRLSSGEYGVILYKAGRVFEKYDNCFTIIK